MATGIYEEQKTNSLYYNNILPLKQQVKINLVS